MPRKVHLFKLEEAKRNQLRQSITVYGTVYRFEFQARRSWFILTELLHNGPKERKRGNWMHKKAPYDDEAQCIY